MFRKIVSSVLLSCFLLGGAAVALPGKASAAPSAVVGIVDFGVLISQHPDAQKANDALQSENEQAKKEFEEKAAALSDKDKQELNQQLFQRVENKRRELLNPILSSIEAAIKTVADAKGLSIVVHKSAAVYGGQDITAEVGKKLTGK